MFKPHPNAVLNELFARRPYQGVDPNSARFLFVGLDANYAPYVERSLIFPSLLRYHEDGPAFWHEHGVHHPFLLPQYVGDGRRYHRTFAKVGFRPQHADLVSFIELLHVPTVGRSQLHSQDLDETHLKFVRRAMFEGTARFVFVSAGVLRLMAASGAFPELTGMKREFGALRVLHEGENRVVFLHLHFSNYGKFELQLQAEAREIAGLVAHSDAGRSVSALAPVGLTSEQSPRVAPAPLPAAPIV